MALQYRVRVSLRGVNASGDKNIVTIPVGALIHVVGDADAQCFVAVRWESRDLLVFQQDLSERVVECDESAA
jgi:hypothetical protein